MHENKEIYISPFSTRYASKEMQEVFSEQFKFRTWRRLWIALARAEKALGLDITDEQIVQMEAFKDDVNYEVAEERERIVRHDVMSHVFAFGKQCPAAEPIIHLGATSCYVGDNTDIIILRKASEIILKKAAQVLKNLSDFAMEYKDMPCLAYTHLQPAQLTTVGKRVALWMYELSQDVVELEHRLDKLLLLGSKGTTGTQASFMELFDGDEEKIRQAVAGFVGEQKQIPPMYSAIKVNGKKLYELAREGKEIERKARTITIFAINIVRFLPPDRFEIDVDCSKGTYIRTLCSDIGKALSCGAHMAELTRTRTGSFALEDAITLGELQTMADEGRQEEAFLSMEAALSDFPKIIVSPKSTKMLYNGGRGYAKFYEAEKELTAGDIAAVFDSEHHLVGLYEVRDEEGFYIKPFKMLI